MKRIAVCSVFIAGLTLAVATLLADVKTQEKSTFKLEGVIGGLAGAFGGGSKDGAISTTALKGTRKLSMNDTRGEIIDLGTEQVFMLDVKKKEYTVKTFAELRKEWQDAQERAAKQAQQDQPKTGQTPASAGAEMEYDVDVKPTGKTKTIAGYPTKETIVTVIARQKGKTLDEGGGFVLTSDIWIGPKIAELEEIRAFQMKYMKAVYGDLFSGESMQQIAALKALFPAFQQFALRADGEAGKIEGTPLATTMTLETVKSPEEMKASQQQSSGGGIGGMIGRRVVGTPKARSTAFTSTLEMVSVATSATDADVALPAGFKKKS